LVFESGVGTLIEMTSGSRSRLRSVVAENFFAWTASATVAPATSSTCERPPLSMSTTRALISNPSTRYPARTISIASGRPT
jgi:hypothetical protein